MTAWYWLEHPNLNWPTGDGLECFGFCQKHCPLSCYFLILIWLWQKSAHASVLGVLFWVESCPGNAWCTDVSFSTHGLADKRSPEKEREQAIVHMALYGGSCFIIASKYVYAIYSSENLTQ